MLYKFGPLDLCILSNCFLFAVFKRELTVKFEKF